MRGKILSAVAAAALAASPNVAAAQAAHAPAPKTEQAQGSEIRGGFLLPLAIIIAIIIGILLLTNDDKPKSP